MALRWPPNRNTPRKRIAYALRWKERARLIHNFMGRWTQGGLTQAIYDNGVDSGLLGGVTGTTVILPTAIKAAYPFQDALPMATFRVWQQNMTGVGYERMQAIIASGIDTQRALILLETADDADIDIDDMES